MTLWVYTPLLLSFLLAVLSRPLARRLSPRTALPALVIAAGLTAAASTWGLVLLVATVLHEAPPVAEQAAAQGLAAPEPVPGIVAAAAVLLAVGLYRLGDSTGRQRSTYQDLRGICDANPAEELVVVASAAPHALAVPGRSGQRGHILVTSGMLIALDGQERAVLLAHERRHLRAHHHWQRVAVDAAAALNPLLRPTREAVAFLLERDADEAAAAAVGSRALAARSLATAALATAHARRGGALAFQQLAVTRRVAALQSAPAPHRPAAAAGVVLIGVATTLAVTDATWAFLRLAALLLPAGF